MIGFLTVVSILYLVFVVAISLCSTYQAFLVSLAILCVMLLAGQCQLKKARTGFLPRVFSETSRAATTKGFQYIYFFIVLFFSVIYWLGDFPGGFNLDADGQWLQAHNVLQYNDWHPFVSTLLIQLVLQVSDSFVFYIAVQIVAFSISVTYLLNCIQKQGVDYRLLVAVAIYIGLNPAIGLNMICMTKDAQFTILIIFMTGFFIRIIATAGEWLNNYIHCFTMIALAVVITLVRHNGFLFILPGLVLLILLYKKPRKKTIISCLSIITLIILIKWPVAAELNVEKHENVLGETAGIPMEMMANALVTDEDHLPIEVHAFLNTIADDESWKENHIVGEWDACKWEFGGTELLKDTTGFELLNYTIETIRECPQACYEAFRESTRIVWTLFNMFPEWIPYVYIEENEHNIEYSPISPFNEVTSLICSLSQWPIIAFAFWNGGMFLAVLLIAFLLMNKKGKKRNALLVFPLLTYVLGTMVLLSGPNQRYFFCEMVLIPPILLSILYNYKKEIVSLS